MDNNKLWDISMSPLEKRLKEYINSYPEYKGIILTGEELSRFTLSMLSANPHEPTDKLLDFFHGELPYTVEQLLSRPAKTKLGDFADPETLGVFFNNQPEFGNVADGFDIAVTRVFRHMPVQWHSNDYFTLLFCVNGKCPILLSQETIEMSSGDIIILAPNTIYASPCYDDETVLVYYLIRTSTFHEVFWKQLSDVSLISEFFASALNGIHGNPYLMFKTDDDPQLRHILYSIYQEIFAHESYANHLVNSLMSVFFLVLFRRYSGNVILSQESSFRWKQEYAQILKYIQENFATITMNDLISHFHYSERQINRIVQICSGRTFSQLRIDLRMRKAATLLSETSLPVQEISETVGYHNLNAFYKVFTKYTGVPPAEWRKTGLGSNNASK